MYSTGNRPEKMTPPGRSELSLAWRAVWRRKIPIALGIALATVLTLQWASRMEPQYRATASLLIETGSASALDLQPGLMLASTPAFNAYMNSQAELIRSRAIVNDVVNTLKLDAHPYFRDPASDASLAQSHARIVDRVQDGIRVDQQTASRLLIIKVTLGDPHLAADVANALAVRYIDWQLNTQTSDALRAARRIEANSGGIKASLDKAEAALQKYLDEQGLVDVDGVTTVAAAQLSASANKLLDARRKRTQAENVYRQVQAAEARGWRDLANLPAVMADTLVQRYAGQLAQAQATIDQLSMRYGTQHPSLRTARTELRMAGAALRERVEHVASAIEQEYRLAERNESALAEAAQSSRAQLAGISSQEARLYALQRDVDSQRLLYDTFIGQLSKTGVSAGFDSAPPRVIDMALPPSQPSAPNARFLVAMAFAASLLAGIAWAILRDLLSDRAHTPRQLEQALGVPVLGSLPEVQRGLGPVVTDLAQSRADPVFCEALVALRARLVDSRPGAVQQVLLVTSALPDEGKSAVASNLALTLAQTGRVLLIEADLRRPVLARQFGLPSSGPGLAEVLQGRAERYEAIQRLGPIDVLFAGALCEGPLELLASQAFTRLMHALRDRYDRIVIDSPPTQAVSDSALLARHVDSALFVVRQGQSRLSLAQRGLAGLARDGLPVEGLVLNRIPRSAFSAAKSSGRPAAGAVKPA